MRILFVLHMLSRINSWCDAKRKLCSLEELPDRWGITRNTWNLNIRTLIIVVYTVFSMCECDQVRSDRHPFWYLTAACYFQPESDNIYGQRCHSTNDKSRLRWFPISELFRFSPTECTWSSYSGRLLWVKHICFLLTFLMRSTTNEIFQERSSLASQHSFSENLDTFGLFILCGTHSANFHNFRIFLRLIMLESLTLKYSAKILIVKLPSSFAAAKNAWSSTSFLFICEIWT